MKRIVLTPDEMRAIEFDWKCSTEKYRRYVEGIYNQHDSTVKLRRLRFPSSPPIPYVDRIGLVP